MEWDKVLRNSVNNGVIRELHLRKIPTIKTCDNWNEVKEIGLINHKTKYAHYKGAIVKYIDGIYYVSDERLKAIEKFRKWNFKTQIKVIDLEAKPGDKEG